MRELVESEEGHFEVEKVEEDVQRVSVDLRQQLDHSSHGVYLLLTIPDL